jgi:hypothetical protein
LAAGFHVWEALAVSEVMSLCEEENVDIIIITAEVDDTRCAELKQHYVTIKLEPDAKINDVIGALWQLFRDKKVTIQ